MKLVFRKYMEFENANGNKQKLAALRQRVEDYLENTFKKSESSGSASSSSESDWCVVTIIIKKTLVR